MSQLTFDIPLDEEERDSPGNFHLVTPESRAWLTTLLQHLPEGRLKERFTELPAVGIAPYTYVGRVVDIINVLAQTTELATRTAAARQLASAAGFRGNELQNYEMRYIAHVVATGSINRIQAVQAQLLRTSSVDVPTNMLPVDEQPLAALPRPEVIPDAVRKLPTLGKVFQFKPKTKSE